MDIHQFLKEYRSFRQKVGEELGIADEELVLKFFLAFKRLQMLSENPFKNYSQIFDSIMNAGLTKEELFDTNGMYEVYQARAKGTNEGFTEIEAKIVDIQMESIGSCM